MKSADELNRLNEINKLILPLLEQACCLLDNVEHHDSLPWIAASNSFKKQLKNAAKQTIKLKSST